MRFFSYNYLSTQFPNLEVLKSNEGRSEKILELKNSNESGNSDLIAFISKMDDESIIFLQWIQQHKELSQFLEGTGLPSRQFHDLFKWKEHLLYRSFSSFLKDFIVHRSLQYRDESDLSKKAIVFSFLPLLPEEDRMFTEQLLFKSITERTTDLMGKSEKAKSEKDLLSISDQLLDPSVVRITDLLSRRSYHLRIGFVDDVLSLLKLNVCTPRLANRIVEKLKVIELNPEHRVKIKEVSKEIKSGELVKEKTPLLKRINAKIYLGTFLFIALVGISIYAIMYADVPEPSGPEPIEISSFEQFSIDERKQIDSLLRDNYSTVYSDSTDRDQYLWMQGNGISLAIRQAIGNNKMETVYNDWILDAELHSKGLFPNCTASSKEVKGPLDGIAPLKDLQGKEEVFLLNESEYDVFMYVFRDEYNGSINASIIEAGKEISINMNQNDKILFVAGNDPSEFIAPKNISSLPSKSFKAHFCTVDANLNESLTSLYSLQLPLKGKNKLMLKGGVGSPFFVADLYGILESF